MARISRNTVEYFPHLANASNGDTITILQEKFGNDGYAFWFRLLERLASTDGHFIDCSDPIRLELLCAKCHIPSEKGILLLNILGELSAIDQSLWKSRVIWCQKFVDNLTSVYKDRGRNPPKKPIIPGNNPEECDNSTENAGSPSNVPGEIPQRKKERKERIKRGIIFTPPTVEEVRAYCQERNNGIDPEYFVNSNTAKGWVVGKLRTPMKDWRATIRTWEGNQKKDNNNGHEPQDDSWKKQMPWEVD